MLKLSVRHGITPRKSIPLLILFLVFILSPKIGFAQNLSQYVGSWASEGEIFLTVTQDGDSLKLKFPENSMWRADVKNVKIEEGFLKFETIYTMTDDTFRKKYGKEHPYSGVINYCEMWQDNKGNMLFRIWTDYMKDQAPVIITKLKE